MAETSLFWTTNAAGSGDQQASYSQADHSDGMRIMAACGGYEGVAPGYLNELACTANGANTVAVNTGGAMVDGKVYINDASQDVNIPSASGAGNTRIDRIVLRANWAGFNVSVTRIAGTDAATPSAPAITQTSETTYDILLCQALVNTSGDVTLTDERTWSAVSANGIKTDAVNTPKIADASVTPAKTSIFPANANAKIFVGKVNSGGAAVRLPGGWSSSRSGTGTYLITHNLGSASYVVAILAYSTGSLYGRVFMQVSYTINNFTFYSGVPTSGGGMDLADSGFTFILITY